ncbi:MAG TPA: hypothetical protein VL492_04680 [Methylovirgula sp.]|nr:hypothetical protein [Methylovirgula sp.]
MKIFSVVLLAFALSAAAQSPLFAQAEPPKPGATPLAPIPPGGIRVTVRPPVDWVKRELRTGNAVTEVYICKSLACFNPSTVSVKSVPTLARHPDPRALEALAKTTLPKMILAQGASQMIMSDGKIVTKILSSKVTELAGYPAIIMETNKTGLPKPEFRAIGLIFAGPIMLIIASQSTVLADAEAHLTSFVSLITFTEGPKTPNDVPATPAVPAQKPPVTSPQNGTSL